MLKSVLKRALGLGTAVVEGARIEGESIIVSARPRRAALRCPACGRRRDGCDTLPARRRRAPDVGSARCYVECAPRRVECPEHGVRAEAVPRARAASSRFTSAFEDAVARLALHMCRFPLLKNPEDLSEGQASALGALRRSGTAPWRGYLLKEGLRAVFRGDPADARASLDRWLSWACRCRIPQFVELSRKVRREREGILRAIELGVSNARVEAVNNKIKVAVRQGHGLRNIDNLIALVMLRCSDLRPALPGRAAA